MRNSSSVAIVAFGLLGFLVAASPVLSQVNCNPRTGYPPGLYVNEHFAGVFRIPLNPPDLQDRAAVQRHLVLAEVWGRTIWKEMLARTHGLCSAHFEVHFPDSRVALVINRTADRLDRGKAFCTQVLDDILQHFEPGDELVKYAVGVLGSTRQGVLWPTDEEVTPPNDAWNISNAILPLMYDKSSLLHR